jgi:predicted kinase
VNGPPAAGKSSLAQRYLADHPLALNLDIDTVRALLGGWMDHQETSGLQARRLALAMARTHLSDGHDVVVPQLVARAEFVEQLAELAQDVGARFVEVFLTVDLSTGRDRLAAAGPSVPGRFNPGELVERNGGADSLDAHHAALRALLAQRSHAIVVDSVDNNLEEAYGALLAALDQRIVQPPSTART